MTDEDRDTANAALLMNEKIANRIREAFLSDVELTAALRSFIQYEIQVAFQQFSIRMAPQYPTQTTGTGTGVYMQPTNTKYYW